MSAITSTAKPTVAEHLNDYPNLVITRTFSKTWGLPSVRLGYILSAEDNIRALLNVRGPYDVNQFAVVALAAALDSPEESLAYVNEVMQSSKPLLQEFLDGRGVDYWPSAANYLWVFPEQPQQVLNALEAADIRVRPKADSDGNQGLRITVGTLAQTEALIGVLEQAL